MIVLIHLKKDKAQKREISRRHALGKQDYIRTPIFSFNRVQGPFRDVYWILEQIMRRGLCSKRVKNKQRS